MYQVDRAKQMVKALAEDTALLYRVPGGGGPLGSNEYELCRFFFCIFNRNDGMGYILHTCVPGSFERGLCAWIFQSSFPW